MDDSTEGVTLFAGFIFDVLSEYQGRERVYGPALKMAEGLDPDKPTALAPMSVYNEICDWIEKNVGPASVRKAGRAIGRRAYDQMVADGSMGERPTPQEILRELKRVASLMIQDPKGRGWEILEESPTRMVMRRTQTFNCTLQEGLLLSLVERTGAKIPMVAHMQCVRNGDEFCEYEVTWLQDD